VAAESRLRMPMALARQIEYRSRGGAAELSSELDSECATGSRSSRVGSRSHSPCQEDPSLRPQSVSYGLSDCTSSTVRRPGI